MKPTLRFWARAPAQLGVAAAFVAIPYLNLRRIQVLSGNFLSFNAFGVPLADPLAALQVELKSGPRPPASWWGRGWRFSWP